MKYLFRGIEEETGLWVYGSLLEDEFRDEAYIVDTTSACGVEYKVEPDSITQCVRGLRVDKNLNEIFEYDIVRLNGDEKRIGLIVSTDEGDRIALIWSNGLFTLLNMRYIGQEEIEVVGDWFHNKDKLPKGVVEYVERI